MCLSAPAWESPPLKERSALFVDLAIEATLPAAPALARDGWTVVPVIQRWCEEPALLPTARLRGLLAATAAQLASNYRLFARSKESHPSRSPRGTVRGVLFLLDGERAGRPGERPRGRQFDNRYCYPSCRFPPRDLLTELGIDTVRYLGRDVPPPDLRPYLESVGCVP